MSEDTSESPLDPERVGPFLILRPLGAGAMGSVHLAELAEDRPYAPKGTRVALKQLHPMLTAHRVVHERFVREGHLGLTIRHASVVATLGVERLALNGVERPSLVMEYVEGRSLDLVIRQMRSVPEALLRHVGARLASALAAIHAASALHRDVKPANILITRDHQVKLGDLGIAHLGDDGTALTGAGDFIGSPAYASPEHFGCGPMTPASDLYSLGCVLWEAAAGRRAFPGREMAEVMRLQLESSPQPLGRIDPQISPFFEELVAALLEKSPERRIGSAEDLAAILEQGERSAWWLERQRHAAEAGGAVAGAARRPRVLRAARLVGRDEPLSLLERAWGEALAGNGRAVLLEGEAGVGKSSVVEALIERTSRRGEPSTVLFGSAPPGGAGLGPLASAVLDHLGEARLDAGLRRLLAAMPRVAGPLAARLRQSGRPSEALPAIIAEVAWCEIAASLSRERPLIWVVEDLHFAAMEDRNAALALARSVAGLRALVVLTSRAGLPPAQRAELSRLPHARIQPLGRLSPRDVVELLREVLGSDQLAAAVAAPIAARSDGNPFFAFEMLRELEERGVLRRGPDGAFMTVGEVGNIEMPSSVGGLIVARLHELTEGERRLLDVGAVIGFEFDADLVARVLGRRRLDVLQVLSSLERRSGVVRTVGGMFRFDHHLLHEVCLAGMSPLLVAEYHELIAEAYQQREVPPGASLDAVPAAAVAFLASHRLRGSHPVKGVALAQRAALHLAAHGQQDGALELLALAPSNGGALDAESRAGLLQARCLALLPRGRHAEAREALDAWIADARGIPDAAARLASLASAASRLGELRDFEAADRLLAELPSLAAAVTDPAALARAAAAEASVRTRELRDTEALAALDRQADLATRASHRELMAIAWNNRSIVMMRAGRLGETLACARQAVELRLSLDEPMLAANAMHAMGSSEILLGRPEAAVETLSRAIAIKKESGDLLGQLRLQSSLLEAHADLGRLDLYHDVLREMSAGAARVQLVETGLLVLDGEAALAALEGRLEESAELYRRHLDADVAHPDAVRTASLLQLALVLEAMDQHEAAWTCSTEALALSPATTAHELAARARCIHAVRLFRGGRRAEARELVEEAWASRRPEGTSVHPVRAARVLVGLDDVAEWSMPSLGSGDVLTARLTLIEAGHADDHVAEVRAMLERMHAHLSGEDLARARSRAPFAVALRRLLGE